MFCLHVCWYTTCVPNNTLGGQKVLSDSLELELQKVVNCTGNQTQFLWKSSQHKQSLTISPVPCLGNSLTFF